MAPLTRNACPSCKSKETLSVTMLVGGSSFSFTSCPVCEWKGWEREGQNIPLGSVLSVVSAR